ncbi:YxeA family protein [Bacillus pseudomycoides]|uniref:YxeA family protein n=1 Tax=Bacillus bingmayongensis TaxID=1150157 RepID=A0ABU5JYD6_9BACI|nr:YxeA family protein [Bacillus pseudomycoides]
MKRYVVLISIMVIFSTMLVGCGNINNMINRTGKDVYYVQLTQEPKKETKRTREGHVVDDYDYSLPGFDEKGIEKKIEFTEHRKLRNDAFLRIYHSDDSGVTSWEEVQIDDLPTKVKEKLSVK